MSDASTDGVNLTGTGLEGVSLGETEIALVDGQNGRLIYRGHDAERLAHEQHVRGRSPTCSGTATCPDDAELAELHAARWSAGMAVPAEVHDAMRALAARRPADGRAAQRPQRRGARCARATRAATRRTRSGRSRRRPRSSPTSRASARAQALVEPRPRARARRELHAQDERRALRTRRRPARSTRTSSSPPSTA